MTLMPPRKISPQQQVVLTMQEWDRLQAAKAQIEFGENADDRLAQENPGECIEQSLTIGTHRTVFNRRIVFTHSHELVGEFGSDRFQ